MNAQGYANEQLQGGGVNPYTTEANAYMGQNPFLDKMVGDVTANMSNAYESGTRATRDAQFARSGGYGSSAWDAQRTRDEGAFSGALGSTLNNMYGDQYNRVCAALRIRLEQAQRPTTARPTEQQRATWYGSRPTEHGLAEHRKLGGGG